MSCFDRKSISWSTKVHFHWGIASMKLWKNSWQLLFFLNNHAMLFWKKWVKKIPPCSHPGSMCWSDHSSYLMLWFLSRANKVAHWGRPLHRCEYKRSHLGCVPGEATQTLMLRWASAVSEMFALWQTILCRASAPQLCGQVPPKNTLLWLICSPSVLTSQMTLYYIAPDLS